MNINSKILIFQNNLFSVFSCEVSDHQGFEVSDYLIVEPKIVSKEKIGGVAIMPICNSMIGLIKIIRPGFQQDLWEIPHGAIEPGESLVQACVRELSEETGFQTVNSELTHLATVAADSGVIAAKVAIYVAELNGNQIHRTPELGIMDVKFFTYAAVAELIETNQIIDSFSQIAFYKSIFEKKIVFPEPDLSI